jgi:hypothetical protein
VLSFNQESVLLDCQDVVRHFLTDYSILARVCDIEDWRKSFHSCGLDLTFVFIELFNFLKDWNSLGTSELVFGPVEAVKAVFKRAGHGDVDQDRNQSSDAVEDQHVDAVPREKPLERLEPQVRC